jgi:hypothetical protein
MVGSTLELDAYSHNLGRRFHQVFHAVPHGQGIKSNAAAETSARVVASSTTDVTVGPFTVKVPTEWVGFSPGDAATLREQYLEQSKQIYQKFSGGEDPAQSVDAAAFHIAGADGAFIVVAFSIPPQSDIINLLKSQAKEKADWGVQQGYIRKYLGLVPVNDDHFSGFYIKTIGKDGNVEVSGGLEHKKLKNTLIQLTLLCPQTWDQGKATNTLTAVLKSLALTAK